mgnify:CR=1 FL=1
MVVILDLCQGRCLNFIIVKQRHPIGKRSWMNCAVRTVFCGLAYDLLATAFTHRSTDPGQFSDTPRADQISFWHNDLTADRAPAREQQIQDRFYYIVHTFSL